MDTRSSASLRWSARIARKGKDWLLIKKKDFAVREGWDPEADTRSVLQGPGDISSTEGAVKAEMPAALEPMLATLGTAAPSGSEWLYEVKWDGYRALCLHRKRQSAYALAPGNQAGQAICAGAAALAQSVKADTAIIDGEVVALDDNGNPSFQHLQNLTGFGTKPALKGMAPPNLNFFAFDLLYLNGYDLRKAALDRPPPTVDVRSCFPARSCATRNTSSVKATNCCKRCAPRAGRNHS